MNTAPSPFIPGTRLQFAWDSTSLGWLKTCPRLYFYSMIEGWRGKGESVHLKFGQIYHGALEFYDKYKATNGAMVEGYIPEFSNANATHDEALEAAVQWAMLATWKRETIDPSTDHQVGRPWSPDHPSKTRETLIRSIIWYLDQFRDDPAQTVILANGRPAVELSFKFDLQHKPSNIDFPNYMLCGHLDRVVNFSGGTYVMDRKTTGSALSGYYFDQYSPDNQMSLYTVAAKVVYQTPVKGVIIDAAQIMVGFTRYGRGFTYRTDAEIEEWLGETKEWLDLAEGYALKERWPRNDKSCNNYGGCTFRHICSKSPEVRQKFLENDFERRPWNPLEAR